MRRKCSTPLPHISSSVSSAADEAWSNLNGTILVNENAVCSIERKEYKGTPRRADKRRITNSSNFATCHIVSAVTGIRARHT
ncbi:hypothetical protein BLNAU_12023 [Blattamonas nauphoetae]|uniref:Uncharacterized protein n=1 Tax=Blattamonas nauphoetae TaxID=2049346 RepID=A0ABQ9XQF2_9EUKA|nr:hypothetical protein BLNAU_12023 [Blattamonas nauphoetae]